MRRQLLGQFVLGVLIGLISGVAISLGILGIVIALVIPVMLGLTTPRFAAMSGALIGLGGEWLLLALNSAISCAKTEDFCGQANIVPIVALAIAILGSGLFFGALTLTSASRKKR
jgi:hypothetical protein